MRVGRLVTIEIVVLSRQPCFSILVRHVMATIAPRFPSVTDLKDLSFTQLQTWLADLGVERYRARQVARWVFKVGVPHASDMTDVPKTLRQTLEQRVHLTQLPGLE